MYRNQGTGRRSHNTYARPLLLSFVGGVADISGLTKSHLDVCNIIQGPFDVCNIIQEPFGCPTTSFRGHLDV